MCPQESFYGRRKLYFILGQGATKSSLLRLEVSVILQARFKSPCNNQIVFRFSCCWYTTEQFQDVLIRSERECTSQSMPINNSVNPHQYTFVIQHVFFLAALSYLQSDHLPCFASFMQCSSSRVSSHSFSIASILVLPVHHFLTLTSDGCSISSSSDTNIILNSTKIKIKIKIKGASILSEEEGEIRRCVSSSFIKAAVLAGRELYL